MCWVAFILLTTFWAGNTARCACFNRASRGLDHYSLPWEGVFAAIRGAAFGAGLYRIVGLEFAVAFAVLITVGQVFAYSRGMRPATDYEASRRSRITRRLFWGTVVRTFG